MANFDKRERREKPDDGFTEKVVFINRVAKVVKEHSFIVILY